MPRALIVSHPAVVAVNQLPYAELADLGWEVTVAVPGEWRHEYSNGRFRHEALPALADQLIACRVLNAGSVQRHVYAMGLKRVLRRTRPDVVFIEEEPTSIPGFQWGRACRSMGIPFGLQMDENLDRDHHRVAKAIRRRSLESAAFVAARSPAAANLAGTWGFEGPTPVVPHGVPLWPGGRAADGDADRPFTIGFAGRFVPEKGLWDLVDAVRDLPDVKLRLVGNGPLLDELQTVELASGPAEIASDVSHDEMATAYASFDVLVLPSRTTPTWAEQFGRVLVEAMWCGVPVIGSDSGEIPWVVKTTGGGLIFEEGNVEELRTLLLQLRENPEERRRLAATGRATVAEIFSVEAAARDLAVAMEAVLADRRMA